MLDWGGGGRHRGPVCDVDAEVNRNLVAPLVAALVDGWQDRQRARQRPQPRLQHISPPAASQTGTHRGLRVSGHCWHRAASLRMCCGRDTLGYTLPPWPFRAGEATQLAAPPLLLWRRQQGPHRHTSELSQCNPNGGNGRNCIELAKQSTSCRAAIPPKSSSQERAAGRGIRAGK